MPPTSQTPIIVGLSGGVDSSVTAFLLQQQGYKVQAIYMQNWEVDNDDPYCTMEQDLCDAKAVCEHLKIPLEIVNFSKEYWQQVFSYCLDEFSAGRTPNPDIYCNSEIKFKCLLEYVLATGARYLATGHYACINHQHNRYTLNKPVDRNKDQSYFLYTLNQYQLAHCLFPLSHYHKTQVREIAANAGLPNHNKKDSTGICFIGERKFKDFLNEFLLATPGQIKSIDGEVVGRHDGLMFYTIGQRQGLFIGGRKLAEDKPWYVVAKDSEHNTLIVAQGHDHPALLATTLTCQAIHWISGEAPQTPLVCTAKIRYRQTEQACRVYPLENSNQYRVQFVEPQRAITPGQAIVFYDQEICLGGSIIIS